MIKQAIKTLFICFLIGLSTSFHGHLNYINQSKWGDACETGANQSPINIPPKIDMVRSNDVFVLGENNYHEIDNKSLEMVHEYKYMLDTLPSESTILIKYKGIEYKYILNDIHFHFKSEHTIENEQMDVEMHMVHKKDPTYVKYQGEDPDKVHQFMVIGVMFKISSDKLNQFIDSLHFKSKEPVNHLKLKEFVDQRNAYIYYQGSLTTPGCDEAVHWVLMDKIESISKMQYDQIVNWIGEEYPQGNARQVYKLNQRTVYYVNAPRTKQNNLKQQTLKCC